MALQDQPPEQPPGSMRRGTVVSFPSEEAFRVWVKAQVEDWEAFIEHTRINQEALHVWRAASNINFPPGAISLSDFERQLAARHDS